MPGRELTGDPPAAAVICNHDEKDHGHPNPEGRNSPT